MRFFLKYLLFWVVILYGFQTVYWWNNENWLIWNKYIPAEIVDIDSEKRDWSLEAILLLSTSLNDLYTEIYDVYSWVLVFNQFPSNKQELVSQAIDTISKQLCHVKQWIINSYTGDYYDFWFHKKIKKRNKNLEVIKGHCYEDHILLQQEGILSYVLEDIWTFQTIPLDLLERLGYTWSTFIDYIASDRLEIGTGSIFFLDNHSLNTIVPLFEFSDYLSKKFKSRFDIVKAIVYSETNDYPFVDGELTLAILAQKDGHLIKITTPYGSLYQETFSDIMSLVQQLFKYSVYDEIDDRIVLPQYFNSYYQKVRTDNNISSENFIKNLTHYYLSALRMYDDQVNEYIALVAQQLHQDIHLRVQLLNTLTNFEKVL